MITRCRWDHPTQTHYSRAHRPDCKLVGCPGCLPCTHDEDGFPVRHCETRRTTRSRCNSHLGPGQARTCPRCIHRTRTDLRQIGDLAALVDAEATHHGVDSEAAMLAGPAADPEAWRHRWASAAAGRIPALDETDDRHPLNILGWWEMAFRDAYTQPTDTTATLTRSVAYLAGHLDRIAQDPDQPWDAFARAVTSTRAHLEDVLAHGTRDEHADAQIECLVCGSTPRRRMLDDGIEDAWWCPGCRRHLAPHEFYLAAAQAVHALQDVILDDATGSSD